MRKLKDLKPERVFKYFEEICAIPHGSGNMEKISAYCEDFAKSHGLRYVRDDANNVIIFKPASVGYETADPIILQGHLDMVCQKDEGIDIDFEKDGIDIYTDGDFIKARGTTLGADNGIAVAMILAILEDNLLRHPAIEAVLTTDEEIGLIGAGRLQFDKLSAKKMINIDAENPKVLTVSCAGGSDFEMKIPIIKEKKEGTVIEVSIKGLKGGHSGVEINSGRVNANILMARILNHIKEENFGIISINGGNKGNAIPFASTARIVAENPDRIVSKISEYADIIKTEISAREEGFVCNIKHAGKGSYDVIEKSLQDKVIFVLLMAPNGVLEMSAEVENLVETSLNLGVLITNENDIELKFALRSNKKSALKFLEDKLYTFATCIDCKVTTSGHYPPWEFNSNSKLKQIYIQKYEEKFGHKPLVEAIHAGLECAIFADGIPGIDAIAIGPEMHDVHTSGERLSISSTREMYELIISVLEICNR